ncbi:MAG: HNH endonuclease [Nitrospinaceae bacterium]|jgi:5-methylcytosine-specific restriction endonuclease McrA|nr:MAG: HNH endonuclease [Nitrospinaceae bacterium]
MLTSFKILVLNYSYEPLQFCSAKRAVVMVLSGRAEQVECDGYCIRTPNSTYPLPAVIRILKMVKRKRRSRVAFSKKNILRRDNYTCQYCGVSKHPLTVDHVLPKSRGGKTDWFNVVVACKPCNLKKSNRTLAEMGISLRRHPARPDLHWMHFVVPSGPESHVRIWKKYLPERVFNRYSVN